MVQFPVASEWKKTSDQFSISSLTNRIQISIPLSTRRIEKKMFTHIRRSAFTPARRFYATTTASIDVTPAKPIQLFAADSGQPLTTSEVFGKGKRVVVFGVPGAYTPVCFHQYYTCCAHTYVFEPPIVLSLMLTTIHL